MWMTGSRLRLNMSVSISQSSGSTKSPLILRVGGASQSVKTSGSAVPSTQQLIRPLALEMRRHPLPRKALIQFSRSAPRFPTKFTRARHRKGGAHHTDSHGVQAISEIDILPISVFFVAFILIWGKNNSTFLITNFQVHLIWRKNYWLALKTVMSYNLKNLNV